MPSRRPWHIATPDGLAELLAEADTVAPDDLPQVIAAFDRRAADLPADVRDGVVSLARAPRRRAARGERMVAAIHLLDVDERDRLVQSAIGGWSDGDEGDSPLLPTIAFWPRAARVALATQWIGDAEWDYDIDGLLAELGPEDIRATFAETVRRPASSMPPEAFASLAAALPAEDRAAAVALVERRYRGRRRVLALAGLARGHADVLGQGSWEPTVRIPAEGRRPTPGRP